MPSTSPFQVAVAAVGKLGRSLIKNKHFILITGLSTYCSVSNATLNRFFSLHYLLPFILAALVVIHILTLHEHGSSNPLGVNSNEDRIPFHPYLVFKDLVTVFLFLLALSIIVCFYPNVLGHSDNYIMANPMSTPASIVPEWYVKRCHA